MPEAGGSAGSPSQVPIPDPTDRTQEDIARSEKVQREITEGQFDVLRERLDAIDKATDLRLELIAHISEQVDEKVVHLREIADEKFDSIALQFKERDTRAERESRDNKVAVDAAFAAQKEAAAKQDESNQKAIDKSEAATNKTIEKLAELFATSNKGIEDKVDDVKSRLGLVESAQNGAAQNKAGGSAAYAQAIALILLALAIVGAGIALVAK